jgi:hypothetical protein
VRTRWLGALGLAALTVGIGTLAWTAWSSDTTHDVDPVADPSPTASTRAVEDPPAERLPPIDPPDGGFAMTVIAEPDRYAEHVALLVFARNTRTEGAGDVRARLLAEADPTLTESGHADLVRLIDARVPDDEMWARMRGNQQWSEWQTQAIWEPGAWQQVVTAGYAEPGWTMRNVSGVEVTHYVEGGADRTTTRERTITVLMRCPAPDTSVDRCHLALLTTAPVA